MATRNVDRTKGLCSHDRRGGVAVRGSLYGPAGGESVSVEKRASYSSDPNHFLSICVSDWSELLHQFYLDYGTTFSESEIDLLVSSEDQGNY